MADKNNITWKTIAVHHQVESINCHYNHKIKIFDIRNGVFLFKKPTADPLVDILIVYQL